MSGEVLILHILCIFEAYFLSAYFTRFWRIFNQLEHILRAFKRIFVRLELISRAFKRILSLFRVYHISFNESRPLLRVAPKLTPRVKA